MSSADTEITQTPVDPDEKEKEAKRWRELAQKLGHEPGDLDQNFSQRRCRVYTLISAKLNSDLRLDTAVFSRLLNLAVQNYLWYHTPPDQRISKESPWLRQATKEEREQLLLLESLPRKAYRWLLEHKVAFAGQGFRLWDLLSQLPFTLPVVIELQKFSVDGDDDPSYHHSLVALARTEAERALLMSPGVNLKGWLEFLLKNLDLAVRDRRHTPIPQHGVEHRAWSFGLRVPEEKDFVLDDSPLPVPKTTQTWRERQRSKELKRDNMFHNLQEAGALFLVCDPGTLQLISQLQQLFSAWSHWDRAVHDEISALHAVFSGLMVGQRQKLMVPPEFCMGLTLLLKQNLYSDYLDSLQSSASDAVAKRYEDLQQALWSLNSELSQDALKSVENESNAVKRPGYDMRQVCAYYTRESLHQLPPTVIMMLNAVLQGFNIVHKRGFNYVAERHLLSDPKARTVSQRESDPEKVQWREELYGLLVKKEFMEESERIVRHQQTVEEQGQALMQQTPEDDSLPELKSTPDPTEEHTDWAVVPEVSPLDPRATDEPESPQMLPEPRPALQRQTSSVVAKPKEE